MPSCLCHPAGVFTVTSCCNPDHLRVYFPLHHSLSLLFALFVSLTGPVHAPEAQLMG